MNLFRRWGNALDCQQFLITAFWNGGSSFDTWLNIGSTKIAQILLTIPFSYAQAGLPSAIAFQVLHLLMGWWGVYIINILYLTYQKKQNPPLQHNQKRNTQLHEVLGGLLGKWWSVATLVSMVPYLFTVCVIQLTACSNIVFEMNDQLPKRTWTVIFGALFSLSIIMPSAQNYRAWSFLGVIATVYTSCYLGVSDVQMSLAPRGYIGYFSALSNFLAVGTEMIPVELMDAMWKPEDFKTPWFYGIIYVCMVSMPASMTVNVVFGDQTLSHPSALKLFPKSKFRDIAIVMLLLHQFVVFGILSWPLYMFCEKFFKVQDSPSFTRRSLLRVPVFLAIWLAALAFPFLQVSAPTGIFGAWSIYIIPCIAYIVIFWEKALSGVPQPAFPKLSWETTFSINLSIIIWMAAMSGLALWVSIAAYIRQGEQVGIFTKCYMCK
ncbi:hypothetical protein SELMODRAFT_438269 [Selaginella moellendorffii]|uniref:Amino acid transporter transmembrane domain-containing protein n=1 Tax=Selaginella moellendorffii TaxID=88036 RepID=D8QVI0_SELML|nr:hypothetical protein SELMODRAFT_438269 [Selaginella moellendorffii]